MSVSFHSWNGQSDIQQWWMYWLLSIILYFSIFGECKKYKHHDQKQWKENEKKISTKINKE